MKIVFKFSEAQNEVTADTYDEFVDLCDEFKDYEPVEPSFTIDGKKYTLAYSASMPLVILTMFLYGYQEGSNK